MSSVAHESLVDIARPDQVDVAAANKYKQADNNYEEYKHSDKKYD